MGMQDGSHRFGPEAGQLLLKTSRTGLGSKAGHDLTIEVTRWTAVAVVDTASPANSSVTVDVDANSFEVRQGTGGVKPLTDGDRADIKKTITEKILHTARHTEIGFRSTRISGQPDAFTVEGDLAIVGIARPVMVECAASADGRVRGTATVKQSEWGIKPYSAFLGALRLKDEVEVQFEVQLPTRG
jgi:polyisoprenoid-binding protein YceI